MHRRALSENLARLADGDRSAFDPVFVMLWPAVLGFARRALNHEADAEDVAQAALLRIFARASEYDQERDGLAWALGITAWQCRTTRKQKSRRREQPLDEAQPLAVDPEAEILAERHRLLEAIQVTLAGLSPLDAETILAAAGFCERPEVQPATFRKRLERALTRFRRRFGARHDSG